MEKKTKTADISVTGISATLTDWQSQENGLIAEIQFFRRYACLIM